MEQETAQDTSDRGFTTLLCTVVLRPALAGERESSYHDLRTGYVGNCVVNLLYTGCNRHTSIHVEETFQWSSRLERLKKTTTHTHIYIYIHFVHIPIKFIV